MRTAGLALAMVLAVVAATAAKAADDVALTGTVEQGALVRGQVPPGSSVGLDGKSIRVAPDGQFIFGLSRDAPAHASLAVVYPDGHSATRDLTVAPRQYDIQRINNLPPQMVTPDPAVMERIKREREEIIAARAVESDQLFFEAAFEWPVTGPISGVYGSQRILNGEPRAPHLGVDVGAPTGTPVHAAAAGTVSLAEHDLYFTGGTVIVDHGYGLSTIYQHMSRLDVAAGDKVEQGQVIGAVGATGRVTGPHLHWGVNWYGIALDPQRIVGPMPK
jgi:murein DD-endopeptidase MepM/ murein hydrolase activator NlpD